MICKRRLYIISLQATSFPVEVILYLNKYFIIYCWLTEVILKFFNASSLQLVNSTIVFVHYVLFVPHEPYVTLVTVSSTEAS